MLTSVQLSFAHAASSLKDMPELIKGSWFIKYNRYETQSACTQNDEVLHTTIAFDIPGITPDTVHDIGRIKFRDIVNDVVAELPVNDDGSYFFQTERGPFREFAEGICDDDGGNCGMSMQYWQAEYNLTYANTLLAIEAFSKSGAHLFSAAIPDVILPNPAHPDVPVFRRVDMKLEGSELVIQTLPDNVDEPIDLQIQYADSERYHLVNIDDIPSDERREHRLQMPDDYVYIGALVDDDKYNSENKVEIYDKNNAIFDCGPGEIKASQ
ncbi:hypothetical protein ACFOY8_15135 [Thalassospira xianhensis]|uniref:Uncharacterized protein n=1 Tax=Thalassospira xianhensis MCCC 1A02616 TaxID=1177929 RepID=A0A367UJM3_9PROT|nr:hypothetical protein [Thalassospira xianhensis]RCK07524.1 hypothetical protein TH5_00090 [Thalassospira xianhensis MCCC 1A02616]